MSISISDRAFVAGLDFLKLTWHLPPRIDFEDTYDGLGDQLEEGQDEFNDDTFGGEPDSKPMGRDFDFFGKTAQVADAIGEEQVRYSLQQPKAPVAPSDSVPDATREPAAVPSAQPKPKRTGYEKYQDPGFIPDLQAKSSVWGIGQTKEPSPQPVPQGKRMLSLEEVEAQLRGQGQPPAPSHPVSLPPQVPEPSLPFQQPPHMPPPPEGFPDFPPQFLQAQLAKGVPPAQLLHPDRKSVV